MSAWKRCPPPVRIALVWGAVFALVYAGVWALFLSFGELAEGVGDAGDPSIVAAWIRLGWFPALFFAGVAVVAASWSDAFAPWPIARVLYAVGVWTFLVLVVAAAVVAARHIGATHRERAHAARPDSGGELYEVVAR